MKYKEFKDWCSQRAGDGRWGLQEAMICISIREEMKATSIFKRKSKWAELEPVANEIVTNTNAIIEKVVGGLDE